MLSQFFQNRSFSRALYITWDLKSQSIQDGVVKCTGQPYLSELVSFYSTHKDKFGYVLMSDNGDSFRILPVEGVKNLVVLLAGCHQSSFLNFINMISFVGFDLYKLFNWVSGTIPIDVVYCTYLPQLSLVLPLVSTPKGEYPPLFFSDVMGKSLSTDRYAEIYGTILEKYFGFLKYANTIFLGDIQKNFYVNRIYAELSPSSCKEIIQNSVVSENFVDVNKLNEFVCFERGNAMAFCGRLEQYKGFDEVVHIAEKAMLLGLIDKLVVTSPSGWVSPQKAGFIDKLKSNKAFEFYFPVGYPEYLRMIEKCGVFVYCQDESFSVLNTADIEMLYVGVVGIFPARMKDVLPDWYPFIYHNKNDIYVLLKYIMDNSDIVKEFRIKISKWIAEKFSNDTTYDWELQKARESVLKHGTSFDKMDIETKIRKYRFINDIVCFVDKYDKEFLFKNFYLDLKKTKITNAFSSTGIPWFTMHDLLVLLKELGYKDECDEFDIKLRKIEK